MKNQESLKSLAKLAKRRLKHQEVILGPKKSAPPQSEEEKVLIEKILDVLRCNHDTPAPLMELIDKKKFEKFSPLEREIYIFNLIDKYNYYKDWYDKSRSENGLVV